MWTSTRYYSKMIYTNTGRTEDEMHSRECVVWFKYISFCQVVSPENLETICWTSKHKQVLRLFGARNTDISYRCIIYELSRIWMNLYKTIQTKNVNSFLTKHKFLRHFGWRLLRIWIKTKATRCQHKTGNFMQLKYEIRSGIIIWKRQRSSNAKHNLG